MGELATQRTLTGPFKRLRALAVSLVRNLLISRLIVALVLSLRGISRVHSRESTELGLWPCSWVCRLLDLVPFVSGGFRTVFYCQHCCLRRLRGGVLCVVVLSSEVSWIWYFGCVRFCALYFGAGVRVPFIFAKFLTSVHIPYNLFCAASSCVLCALVSSWIHLP